MNTLRVTCNNYNPKDIYNIDETGLFWRYAPNSGINLLDNPTSGIKKDKVRILLALISNTTGSDRITIWAIRKVVVSRALRGVNLSAMSVV
jgi:hypothetical protein